MDMHIENAQNGPIYAPNSKY